MQSKNLFLLLFSLSLLLLSGCDTPPPEPDNQQDEIVIESIDDILFDETVEPGNANDDDDNPNENDPDDGIRDDNPDGPPPTREPPPPPPPTSPLGLAGHREDVAEVLYVIDGDTIEVKIDGEEYRVRYIGIDTPERDEPWYEEATELNRELVEGEEVILIQDISDTDQYGRLLRYVYLDDGTFVNEAILRAGLAHTVVYRPDDTLIEQLEVAEEYALERGLGLWDEDEEYDDEERLGDDVECDCSRNRYDCRDFAYQDDAQICYEYCFDVTGEDIHRLDGGNDGEACESLP